MLAFKGVLSSSENENPLDEVDCIEPTMGLTEKNYKKNIVATKLE